MLIPENPKIYHIVHIDRLPSIINDGYLWCDAEITKRSYEGSSIGMNKIKERRLKELTLNSHPNLYVGECVPFYFCPRSVMLYVINRKDSPDLTYFGGQKDIIHLEADLRESVKWAEDNNKRWAFTLSNAGSRYFEDRCDLKNLDEINWDAVHAHSWQNCRQYKQAEFLLENSFPWHLFNRIGVKSQSCYQQAYNILSTSTHQPSLEIKADWYY
jgi:hypothetical protein